MGDKVEEKVSPESKSKSKGKGKGKGILVPGARRPYISNQRHKKIGFQDELRALLRKHNLEWDEHYLWD